jgi:hypothetical protein
VRSFTDDAGTRWEVTLGKESWGTLVALFAPAGGGDARTSILTADTMFDASAELDSLSDDALRERLRASRPWS